jgi:hypothetical protein
MIAGSREKINLETRNYVPGEIIVKFKESKINLKSNNANSTMSSFAREK